MYKSYPSIPNSHLVCYLKDSAKSYPSPIVILLNRKNEFSEEATLALTHSSRVKKGKVNGSNLNVVPLSLLAVLDSVSRPSVAA